MRKHQVRDRSLHQYLTPEWAAQAIVDKLFQLDPSDRVLEPACGAGAFLQAVPDDLEAVGVELCSSLAEEARQHTGRRIICGDFRTVELDFQPTVILGNPPYRQKLLEEFLDRAYRVLPNNGRCGFLLSTHLVQTPEHVLRWADKWSIEQEIVPRTLFPRAIRPLVFVTFYKHRARYLQGFALYQEASDVTKFSRAAKLLLISGRPRFPCWRAVVDWALRHCGGQASLPELYTAIDPVRPTQNQWWKDKVRQVLQRYYRQVRRGVWSHAA